MALFKKYFKKLKQHHFFKKDDPTSKTDYGPVSTLPNFSKIFVKLIYLQLNDYMENKFSIYLTCFQKNDGTQHTLLKIIETWKAKLNMVHKVGVIYIDLSKAFGSLKYELLIAKLKCYGLGQSALEFFKSYFSNRYHCCDIDNTLGDWRKIIAGLPQGSILGPILSNIFLNDIYIFIFKRH